MIWKGYGVSRERNWVSIGWVRRKRDGIRIIWVGCRSSSCCWKWIRWIGNGKGGWMGRELNFCFSGKRDRVRRIMGWFYV